MQMFCLWIDFGTPGSSFGIIHVEFEYFSKSCTHVDIKCVRKCKVVLVWSSTYTFTVSKSTQHLLSLSTLTKCIQILHNMR